MANRTPLVRRFSNGNKEHWEKGFDEQWDAVVQGAIFYGGSYAKDVAEDLLAKAVALAPEESGDLKASGEVKRDSKSKGEFVAYTVSFDTRRTNDESRANNFNYAIRVHEDPMHSENHHFLSRPYQENAKLYIEYLRDGIREMLGDRKYNKMYGGKK